MQVPGFSQVGVFLQNVEQTPKWVFPGQLSVLLRASSDTLPTAVNLRRWHIHCNAKGVLCDFNRQTTVHILGGCTVALSQQRYTFHCNQVLYILASKLSTLFADCENVIVFADLHGLHFNESPQETIPLTVLVPSYRLILLSMIPFLHQWELYS